MTNLFQMGRTEIRLKPEAVLRGRIYIEEIRTDNIRFGTARTVSGAIPGRTPRSKETREKTEAPPLIDLSNFDVMALINQEYERLNSPKIYDEAINAYDEAVARWMNQVETARLRVVELRTASQTVLNLNVNSIRDVNAIHSAIQDINNLVTAVQNTADEGANIVSGIENDINLAIQLEQDARNALLNDINQLKSYVDLGSGAAFNAIEPFIRDILSDTAEQYLDYGIMALETLEKLKALSEAHPRSDKPKKEPKVVFKGRNVIFPVVSYPKFFLGILASDFTIDAWNWSFDLRDVSSNPDLTGKPVSLTLGLNETSGSLQRRAGFRGSADFRTNPRERFNAVVNGSGFPLSLGDQLSMVGINGFTGNSDFSVNLSGLANGGFTAGGDIGIKDAQLLNPRGTLAEAAGIAVSEADIIHFGIQYIHHVEKSDEFNITSNIAELITQAIRRTAEALAQRAMDEIERVLRQKINQYIDGRFVNKDELDLLFRTARGDKAAADQLMEALVKKREDFEQRLRDEASGRIDQAIQGQIPSLPNIRFP
jgi:flagellar biosynthesis chaperone FliJ